MLARGTGLGVALWMLLAGGAHAGEVEVRTEHERLVLEGQQGRGYHWIEPEEMLVLRVEGPANLGLRVHKVMEASRPTAAVVDLTVVRDDLEQGTVRFRLPPARDARIIGHEKLMVSGEVLVKIEVPDGVHRYRVIATGPGVGLMLETFLGLQDRKEVVVATPGQVEVPVQPREPTTAERRGSTRGAEKEEPPASPPQLQPQEPEVLPPVAAARDRGADVIVQRPIVYRETHRFGPATRVAGTATGMLMAGAMSLLASGGALEQRARDEQVQIPAGVLHDRAQRTFRASAVLGVLAASAAVVTLVCYLVEEPDRRRDEAGAASGAFVVRF